MIVEVIVAIASLAYIGYMVCQQQKKLVIKRTNIPELQQYDVDNTHVIITTDRFEIIHTCASNDCGAELRRKNKYNFELDTETESCLILSRFKSVRLLKRNACPGNYFIVDTNKLHISCEELDNLPELPKLTLIVGHE